MARDVDEGPTREHDAAERDKTEHYRNHRDVRRDPRQQLAYSPPTIVVCHVDSLPVGPSSVQARRALAGRTRVGGAQGVRGEDGLTAAGGYRRRRAIDAVALAPELALGSGRSFGTDRCVKIASSRGTDNRSSNETSGCGRRGSHADPRPQPISH
jgi:hypothetical protein